MLRIRRRIFCTWATCDNIKSICSSPKYSVNACRYTLDLDSAVNYPMSNYLEYFPSAVQQYRNTVLTMTVRRISGRNAFN